MSRRWLAAAIATVLWTAGCAHREPETPPAAGLASWSAADAELLAWRSDDPSFAQDRALEASGLTASDRHLYVVAEKYRTLLRLEARSDLVAQSTTLDVPAGSELEGVALAGSTLYICDEANAALYAVDLPGDGGLPPSLPVRRLSLEGVDVRGGKTGLEGIVVSADEQRLFLLNERSYRMAGCTAEIHILERTAEGFAATAAPLVIALEDCDWRVAGLAADGGRLLAIRSRYPGERYEIIAIDPESAEVEVVLDITEFGRSLRSRGWGNNLEGIVVGPDGDLYLVSDNADTQVAIHTRPPWSAERTALIRLPRVR